MAISRMQQPRQMYGLGSFVKKAVRGVKKIVKSPIGKAALGIGLGAYAGGLGPFGAGGSLSGVKGAGFLRNMFAAKSLSPKAIGVDKFGKTIFERQAPGFFSGAGNFLKSMVPGTAGFSGKNLALGLGATAVATPFIQKAMGVGPYEEIEEEVEDNNFIDPYAAMMMARNRDPYMRFLPNENYVQDGFYLPQNAANGGRIGYADGMMVEEEDEMLNLPTRMRRGFANGEMVEAEGPQLPPEAEKYLQEEYKKYISQGGDLSYPEFKQLVLQQASGEQGPEQEDIMTSESETVQTEPQMPMMMAGGGAVPGSNVPGYTTPAGYNRFDYRTGGVPTRVGAEEGGLMNLGGMEKDYRAEGGFVPIGKKEKADDVPARLSVNEFVFTADAVRNAGGGDIDKGAEVMENLMNNLEQGGQVSEDSQGLEGAQAMYDQQQMLQSRME